MSKHELTRKVRELRELRQLAEELAAEITAIEDDIKAEMTAQGVEEMTVDVFKIRWALVKGSRFDTVAFRRAMPELAQQFTRQTESHRFTVQ